ncbi:MULTISPECIES: hypothetical protein [Brevibacillus]|uniref:hypothetical protein n=1 Tax=Brevibacillus TaxID=55080 RepID=UPI001C8D9172|nr:MULTISPECIES: hypothetical protein [Brevibacillus]MBY0085715.1 hypothetical protein [Brevibacillus brevis]MCE0449902.1 hypothetical protein [Brevibacillus sp. AF8]MCM3145942.1 hypothetical protein [Brevibacillus sp. MER 51]UKK97409.1 hypothetical protein FO446_08265 [Brevibacillus brevis]
MSTVKLSQWETMLLEAARAHGFVDEEIIHKLRKGDPAPFSDVEGGKYDYTHLFELSKNDPSTLEAAIREGYQIKFTTFNGIKFLLNKRYNIQAERDYHVEETALHRVRLRDDALAWMRRTISPNWRIVELEKLANTKETLVRFELAAS